ncbi:MULTISPECIES: hypothetical protein [unclassified Wolbachia]
MKNLSLLHKHCHDQLHGSMHDKSPYQEKVERKLRRFCHENDASNCSGMQ